ncbi:MAG: twin-arginine translocation signal domain-containing protein, partial [Gammaproteobacteria bacterium]
MARIEDQDKHPQERSDDQLSKPGIVSRRNFIAATAGVAAVACAPAEQEKAQARVADAEATAAEKMAAAPSAPFDT